MDNQEAVKKFVFGLNQQSITAKINAGLYALKVETVISELFITTTLAVPCVSPVKDVEKTLTDIIVAKDVKWGVENPYQLIEEHHLKAYKLAIDKEDKLYDLNSNPSSYIHGMTESEEAMITASALKYTQLAVGVLNNGDYVLTSCEHSPINKLDFEITEVSTNVVLHTTVGDLRVKILNTNKSILSVSVYRSFMDVHLFDFDQNTIDHINNYKQTKYLLNVLENYTIATA